jgi:hypothetical protein
MAAQPIDLDRRGGGDELAKFIVLAERFANIADQLKGNQTTARH